MTSASELVVSGFWALPSPSQAPGGGREDEDGDDEEAVDGCGHDAVIVEQTRRKRGPVLTVAAVSTCCSVEAKAAAALPSVAAAQ